MEEKEKRGEQEKVGEVVIAMEGRRLRLVESLTAAQLQESFGQANEESWSQSQPLEKFPLCAQSWVGSNSWEVWPSYEHGGGSRTTSRATVNYATAGDLSDTFRGCCIYCLHLPREKWSLSVSFISFTWLTTLLLQPRERLQLFHT